MSSPESREINLVRCIKCGKILKCSRYDTLALLDHIRTDHPEVDIIDTDTKKKRTATGKGVARSTPKEYLNSVSKSSERAKLKQVDTIEYCDSSDEECYVRRNEGLAEEKHVSYENTENEERSEKWPKMPKAVKNVDLTHPSIRSEILEKYPEIRECEYMPRNPNAEVVYTRRYLVGIPPAVSATALKQPFQHSLYQTSIENWCPANGTIYCPKCGCNKRPLIKIKAEHFTYNEWLSCCLLSCWPFCFLPWILPNRQSRECLYCANCRTFLGMYDRNKNCMTPNRLYIATDMDEHSRGKPAEEDEKHLREKLIVENETTTQSSAADSLKSKNLPSITINGKELPPETVARIQKYKRFSTLVGLDLDALSNSAESAKPTHQGESNKENINAPQSP